MDGIPEEGRAAVAEALKATRDAWRSAAKDAPEALVTGCRAALDALANNSMCGER